MCITLIGGPAGRAGWKDVFRNEKRKLSADCTEDRRAGRRAAEKGGAGCRKGQLSGPPFSAAQLTVQPTGPSCSAACLPAYLQNVTVFEKQKFSGKSKPKT